MIAYDGLGHPLNSYTHAYQVGLSAAQFARIMASGISVRLPFDMPAGDIDLRIGVHDLNAGLRRLLDIPLETPAAPQNWRLCFVSGHKFTRAEIATKGAGL